METKLSAVKSWQPRLLSVLRMVAAFLFMQHGAQKMFGVLGGEEVPLMSLMGLAGILETLGGGLLLLGLGSRLVAFLLSGQMAFAYFMVHAPQDFWPIVNHGELAVLFCFLFLYLTVSGPGPWSLDGLLKRKSG